jgi:hypothetical protein
VGEGKPGEGEAGEARRCGAVMRFLRRAWTKRKSDLEGEWAGGG